MRFTPIRWMLATGVVVVVAAVAVVLVVSGRHDADGVSGRRPELAVGTLVDRATPPLGLLDEQGRSLALGSLRGRWLIVAPSLTLCGEVCPMTTGALIRVRERLRQEGLADRVTVAEMTVDPWRDTPARLRAYRRATNVDFSLWTGTRAQVRRFWNFFGVFYKKVPPDRPAPIDWLTHEPETMDVMHTDGLFIVDPEGRERVAVVGMPDVGGRLPADLRRLLDEEGLRNLAHPQMAWTPEEVLGDLHELMRTTPEGRRS